MSIFTIRVELHDATRQDYLNLANDLARQSVTDVLSADNGTSYKMPPGEYNYEGTATLDAVHDAVVASANKTGRRFAVLATEGIRRSWVGLPPAQARRSA